MADAFRKAALRCDPPPPAGLPSRSINKCDKPLGLKHDALSPSPRISAKKRTARSLIRSARAGHLLSARRNAGRRQRRRLRARATIWPPAILRDGYRRRDALWRRPGICLHAQVWVSRLHGSESPVGGGGEDPDGPRPLAQHARHNTPSDEIHTNKTPTQSTVVQINERIRHTPLQKSYTSLNSPKTPPTEKKITPQNSHNKTKTTKIDNSPKISLQPPQTPIPPSSFPSLLSFPFPPFPSPLSLPPSALRDAAP